jgi:hypothetical protein
MTRLLPGAFSTNDCGWSMSLRLVVRGTQGFDIFVVWATPLANEALLTTLLIPLTLALLERLARISMFPTGPPVPSARCFRFLKVRARSVG